MRVVIVGAGIGGLTAAIALRRVGVDAVVLEQAPELREVGAGISLWPNAINAFRRLGLGDAVEASGARVGDTDIRDWRGRVAAPVVLGPDRGALRRAVDHDPARRPPHDPARGARIPAAYVSAPGACRSTRTAPASASGSPTAAPRHCDVAIGADGLHSMVRAATVGDGPPRDSGLRAWRAVVSVDRAAGRAVDVGEYWGHGSLFGVQSLGEDSFYWYAASKARGADQAPGAEKDDLLRRFGSWAAPIPELIEATDATRPSCATTSTTVACRSSLAFGRVALLGDAAHPMLPMPRTGRLPGDRGR